MNLGNKVIVITGAASGIGEAMARRMFSENPTALVLADLNAEPLEALANELGARARAVICDVSAPEQVAALVDQTIEKHGHIDLFCSNAGIATGKGIEATDAEWDRIWHVNVMAMVHVARHLLAHATPERRSRLLVTASAAGLLTNLGDAPYTATKHAAVGMAEWLSITHADDGLDVSCLCPQGVKTPMVMSGLEDNQLAAETVKMMGLIEPEDVADAVITGLRTEDFLILPHPEVHKYALNKATDTNRWLKSMTDLNRSLQAL